jgi:NADPH:quinone reductase-like Zn-dependent oxidoreductase
MKTTLVHHNGGPPQIEIREVDAPEPGPGQVRIQVRAAGVNPVDVAVREGWLAEAGLMPAEGTFGSGWDVAGEIDALGDGVTRFAVGDAVVGLHDRLIVGSKTHAEQVVLDADAVAHAPRNATWAEAATLPLNALTAWQALDLIDLAAGQTLLVTGAAGALGGFLVELGALRGLRVVAVAGADDEALVRHLGASEFVARTDAIGEAVRAVVPGGVDGATDAAVIGAPALEAVRNRGRYINFVSGRAPEQLRGTDVRTQFIYADGHQLELLVALVEAGRLTPRVAQTLPLSEVANALDRQAGGGLRGRLVLEP